MELDVDERDLGEHLDDETIAVLRIGAPWWVVSEAVASVRMSHDMDGTQVLF